MENKDFVMPFGKHKGKPLEKVPLLYLDWVNNLPDLYDDTRAAVSGYLKEPEAAKELAKQLAEKEDYQS